MFIEKLDRHQWTLKEAKEHIAKLIRAQLEREQKGPNPRPAWARQDPVEKSEEEARSELMTALRDGDLHATGRLSLRRRERYATGYSAWEFHSSYPQPISPGHWREGRLGHMGKNLEYAEGEFIDIRIPRVMVLTIWPELPLDARPQTSGSETVYTTPYMDLMQAAIQQYGLSATHQDKKESLVAWFLEREVDGEPVSRNLAEAMATLIRLPQSQRGGAKRMVGPDLRDTG